MSDLRKRITEDEGSLQKLMSYIPGFAGYRERQIRRKADQMVREYLVGMLDDVREDMDEFLNRWAREEDLAKLDDLDRVRRRLGESRDKLRFTDYGYTGWFDAAKIQQSELNSLYDYDLGLREQIVAVGGAIQSLAEASDENVAERISEALAQIDYLAEAIEKREEVTARLIPE